MLRKINKENLIIWIMIALFYVSLLFVLHLIIPLIFSPIADLSNFEVLLMVVSTLVIAFFIANKIATNIYLKFFTRKKTKK